MSTTKEVQTTEKKKDQLTEFVPFGSKDAIKLSAGIVRNFVANPTKSGQYPDERQCVKFVMLCKAKKLNPFEGDAFLIGYDGREGPEFSLVTAHQAFLKRAEANAEYDGMSSGVIVEAAIDAADDYSKVRVIRQKAGRIVYEREGDLVFDDEKLVGGWAIVNFKGRSTPIVRRANLSTFIKSYGLWAKKESQPSMIVKCAEADALRSSFPTLLGGLYLEHEMRSGMVEGHAEPVQQPSSGAAESNAMLNAKPEPTPEPEPVEAEVVSE